MKTKKLKLKILRISIFLLLLLLLITGSVLFINKPTKADTSVGFNEGSGTTVTDSISTTNVGTITNALWKTQDDCLSGSCIYFDGTGDYISFGDNANYDFVAATNWTIELWFKTPAISSGTRVLISKYNATSAGYKIYMSSDGKMNFGIDDDTTWGPDDIATSKSRYDDSRWHHLTAVKTGTSKITLYIDAQRVGEDASLSATGTLVNANNFYLGIDGDGTSNGFLGFLDELKIYTTTARSTDQIKTDATKTTSEHGAATSFASNTSALNDGLVGYWKMDEGSGNAADSSGNNTSLTNTNSATFTNGKYGNSTNLIKASSQYFTSASTTPLSVTQSLTLSAWINPSSVTAGTQFDIANKWDGNNSSYSLAQYGSELRFYINSFNNYVSSTNANLATGNFYHVVAVYDPIQRKVYLYSNGVQLNTTTTGTIPASINANSGRFFVGAGTGGAGTEGPSYPGTASDNASIGTSIWNNPNNAKADDAAYTSTSSLFLNDITHYLTLSNFGFSLPSDATINGITASIDRLMTNTSNSIKDYQIRIIKGGTIGATERADTSIFWPIVATSKNYGSSIDLWGETWLYSDINAATFGIAVSAKRTACVAPDTKIKTISGETEIKNIRIGDLVLSQNTNGILEYKPVSHLYSDQDMLYELKTISGLTIKATGNHPFATTKSYKTLAELKLGDPVWVMLNNQITLDLVLSIYKLGQGPVNNIEVTDNHNYFANSFLVHNSAMSFIPQIDSVNLTIDYYRTPIIDFFNGSIDEVRVYNRALSPSEVTQLYNWAPGPVGYWKMDENTGTSTLDSSGNAYTGSLVGIPTWSTGKFGSGLKFNGTNQAVTATIADPGFYNTVELWIYPTTSVASKTFVTTSKVTTDSSSRPIYGGCTGTAISLNQWTYITATSTDSTHCNIYQNGILTATNAVTGVTLGTSVNIAASSFEGIIDDVKIYNYARTPTQITEDMNGGHPAPGSPVGSALIHYSFDDEYGDVAHNSGSLGQNYNGDLAGISITCPGDALCPTWTKNGQIGGAVFFNGSNTSIDSSSSSTVFNTQTQTISAWFKRTGAVDGSNGAGIAGRWQTNEGAFIWIAPSNEIQFPVGVGPHVGSGITAQLNTWYHVVGTFDGATSTIYVNGKKMNSQARSTTLASITQNFEIGQYAENSSTKFTGFIDEVKFYNFALTEDQVKLEYNQGKSYILGSLGTDSTGTASNSASIAYCVPGSSDPCSAPVVELKFDENMGTLADDTSANNNPGYFHNKITWVPGKKGSAVSYNVASDYIDVSTSSSIDNLTTITAEAWIYPKSLGPSNMGRIFQKDSASFAKAFTLNASNSLSYLQGWTTSTGGYAQWDTPSNSVVLNQWNHVVVTYDRSSTANNPIIYINGIPQTLTETQAPSGTVVSDAGTLYIGNRSNSGLYDRTFDGYIDNFVYYNYIRTPAQVTWNYNRGAPIAQYDFDECSGAILHNVISNSLNGTITPGASGQTAVGDCSTNASTMWYNGRTGKYSSSLNFDGTDDYVTVSDNANLRFDTSTQDFSIFAWVKRSATGAIHTILSKEDADNDGWRLIINADNTFTCSANSTDITSTATIDTNWHHVGCIINRGGTSQAYYDGVKTGTAITTSSITMATSANLVIGARSYATTNYFSGLIDDARIYNYALTPTQVKTLYNNNSAVSF